MSEKSVLEAGAVSSMVKDVHWFWGEDGKLVADGQSFWILRESDGGPRRVIKAERGDACEIVAVDGEQSGTFCVRLNLDAADGAEEPVAGSSDCVTLEYGEYQRLVAWARSCGIEMRNLSRERRIAESATAAIVESKEDATSGFPVRSHPAITSLPPQAPRPRAAAVFVEFANVRVDAHCNSATGRTVITDGPLAETRFLDPTAAVIAVARRSLVDVPIPVSGWSTWLVDDGTGRTLEEWVDDMDREVVQ